MALVRFGGGVSELRGSIAGNVFSRSRAGAIVRNRAVPINPSTEAQSIVRGRMQITADEFKALTKPQVLAWNEFAATQERINRIGETYVPSGKQIYTETSLVNQIVGAAAASDLGNLVSDPNLPGLDAFTVNMTVDGTALNTFTVTDLVRTSNTTHLIIQATPPLLATIGNAKKYFRQLLVIVDNNTVDLEATYNLAYPELVDSWATLEGTVVNIRIRAANDATGLAGSWVYGSVAVPAAA